MRNLPSDRKLYLLRQNRQMRSTVSNNNGPSWTSHAASLGPTRASQFLPALVPQLTGDSGLMKRFSITNWGSSTPELTSTSPKTNTPSTLETSTDKPDEIRPLNLKVLEAFGVAGGLHQADPPRRHHPGSRLRILQRQHPTFKASVLEELTI